MPDPPPPNPDQPDPHQTIPSDTDRSAGDATRLAALPAPPVGNTGATGRRRLIGDHHAHPPRSSREVEAQRDEGEGASRAPAWHPPGSGDQAGSGWIRASISAPISAWAIDRS